MSEFDFVETPEKPAQEFRVRTAIKKPLPIKFARATTDNLDDIARWIAENGGSARVGNDRLYIQTIEGPFTVRPGNVVIQGTAGEFYEHDGELFDKNYVVQPDTAT